MSEESEHDLVGHRGSCLYREKIRREETTLRRGYMGDPPPTSEAVEFARSQLFLQPTVAAYWTQRRKEARTLAGLDGVYDKPGSSAAAEPKTQPSGSSSSTAAPLGRHLAIPDRPPITTTEKMSFAAALSLKSGGRASHFAPSGLMGDDWKESIGGLGSLAECGVWPYRPRRIDHLSQTEVRKRAERMMHQRMGQRRGLGGTIL